MGGQSAQQPSGYPDFSGRYEGLVKSQSHGDVPVVVDIRQDNRNINGLMHTPLGDFEITRGDFNAGKLILVVESYDDDGTITVRLEGDRLVGDFVGFGDSGRVELRRTSPPSPIVRPIIVRPILSLTRERWREDLQYLARELPQKHKNAFHRISREQFERAVAELDSKIPTLQDSDIVMEMSHIVAMIGDGHTNLGWHGLFPRVPLRLFWFGKELRVIETVGAYSKALGTRVVKIGGVDIREAYRRDQPYISQGETLEFILNANAQNMIYPAHLHTLGLAPDTTHALYTFEDDRGKRFTLDLKAIPLEEHLNWLDAAKKKALYVERPDEPLWYKYLPETQTLYFNFNGYPRRRAFSKFSQELFDFIDHQRVNKLIVDMRQNGGGDFSRGREFIISKLKQRPSIIKRGHLFVIIGRRTFSAGMVNAADFRSEMQAIIVGEPTGQRPNSYSENRGFSLPNSHLDVSYSTQYYKFQETDTPGLIPDIRIDPDWDSYKQGRDSALERILAYSSSN